MSHTWPRRRSDSDCQRSLSGLSWSPCSQLWGDLSTAQSETPLCGLAVQSPGMWPSWPRGGPCTHWASPGAPAQVSVHREPVSAERTSPSDSSRPSVALFLRISITKSSPPTDNGRRGDCCHPHFTEKKTEAQRRGRLAQAHTGSQLGFRPRRSGSGAELLAHPTPPARLPGSSQGEPSLLFGCGRPGSAPCPGPWQPHVLCELQQSRFKWGWGTPCTLPPQQKQF